MNFWAFGMSILALAGLIAYILVNELAPKSTPKSSPAAPTPATSPTNNVPSPTTDTGISDVDTFIKDNFKMSDDKTTIVISAPLIVRGTLNVMDAAHVVTLSVDKTAIVSGDLQLAGSLSSNATTQPIIISGPLTVGGVTTLNGNAKVNGTFTAGGVTTFNGDAKVTGTLTAPAITTTIITPAILGVANTATGLYPVTIMGDLSVDGFLGVNVGNHKSLTPNDTNKNTLRWYNGDGAGKYNYSTSGNGSGAAANKNFPIGNTA